MGVGGGGMGDLNGSLLLGGGSWIVFLLLEGSFTISWGRLGGGGGGSSLVWGAGSFPCAPPPPPLD